MYYTVGQERFCTVSSHIKLEDTVQYRFMEAPRHIFLQFRVRYKKSQ